jgi:hypothetical protein
MVLLILNWVLDEGFSFFVDVDWASPLFGATKPESRTKKLTHHSLERGWIVAQSNGT